MLKDRINFHKKEFTKKDALISKWLLNQRNEIPRNITVASKVIGVSPSALTRFCQKIKLGGWSELIFSAKQETKKAYKSFGDGALNNIVYSLSRTENKINKDGIKIIAKKILETKHICLYGESFTEMIATQFSRKLNKIGITTNLFNVASDIAVIMPRTDSVHILISMSGMNPNIKKAAKKIKHIKKENQRIYSIGSTSYSNIENDVDEFIGGEFYQESGMDPYELPYIAAYSLNFIMDKLFEEIYNSDSDKYTKIINDIAKEKKR